MNAPTFAFVLTQYRFDEDGEPEKQCTKCKDWWPATLEFFYRDPKVGFNAWCKPCWTEHRRERRLKARTP